MRKENPVFKERRKLLIETIATLKDNPKDAHLIVMKRSVSDLRFAREIGIDVDALPQDPRPASELELIEKYNGPRAK